MALELPDGFPIETITWRSRGYLDQSEIKALENSAMVGTRVYAMGTPLGIENTVTSGIVSSLRRLPAPHNPLDSVSYVQTDAPINEGTVAGH